MRKFILSKQMLTLKDLTVLPVYPFPLDFLSCQYFTFSFFSFLHTSSFHIFSPFQMTGLTFGFGRGTGRAARVAKIWTASLLTKC
jgi:hypothetical protein